ncbi:FGGY family carbohydrate kinase [Streptomyces sp. LHD-70]|uniref:xylulokinase n=1 Tax=Streptomyces sp. LHD-70 TaxID=3072140 RepID=UPI00280D4BFE|nr:FGGY family carbohydrate kinase [Streptomyces sp. LHD-70]MDQ8706103.1 FGGY family carbohydrate kinase [Streptomyces sp. LHD-70]
MSRHWLIGADVGSSCLKAALVHPERGVVAISEQFYPMHRPHPGWAQNDPEDWYQALALAVPAVLAQADVAPADVAALCLVGQRDIAVLTDERGQALAPVIHWTDRRDPDETSAAYNRLGRQRLVDMTGTLPIPGLVLPNLLWTRRHQPNLWRRVRHALQPKDYLAHRLTGDIGTDPTGPTRSILNDWRTGTWSEDLCDVYGIPRELLPDVKYQPWQVRTELGAAAHEIGLTPGTLLVAGGGDDPAAALGSGVIDAGDVSIGTGSSMSWRAVAQRPVFDPTGLTGLMPHVVPDCYLHEMVAVGSGTTLRWLRGAFGGNSTYEELIAATDKVGPGSDGLLCFPYIEGASVPVQDDHVRAVFHGISGHHGLPHFVRSTLEGIAYQYPALLQALTERGLKVTSMTISDGEARSTTWNQIKADVLGHSLIPALRVEAPSIGAAILAGIGSGAFATAREGVDAVVEVNSPVQPTPDGYRTYQDLRLQWERTRDQVFPQLAGHTAALH